MGMNSQLHFVGQSNIRSDSESRQIVQLTLLCPCTRLRPEGLSAGTRALVCHLGKASSVSVFPHTVIMRFNSLPFRLPRLLLQLALPTKDGSPSILHGTGRVFSRAYCREGHTL